MDKYNLLSIGLVGFAVILLLFFFYFATILILGAQINAFFLNIINHSLMVWELV